MTAPMRRERDLSPILGDLAMAPYPDYVDDVLGRTGRMRQRPAWTFPGRWLPMDLTTRAAPISRLPLRQIGILILITVLLGVALAIAVGSQQQRIPAPFGPAANGSITYVNNGDIFVGDPATGKTRLVVGGPEVDSGPGYSADGTLIAFIRAVDATRWDLYTVRPDGSDLRRITPTPIPNDSWANWSPDSRSVATIHRVEYSGDGCALTFCHKDQLDLFPATGAGPIVTLASANRITEFHYRPPDAKEVLFRAGEDPGNGGDPNFSLYVMNVDGTNIRRIAERAVDGESLDLTSATYSADGSRIFVNRWTPTASYGKPGCCQLFVMNADGSDEHQFVPNTTGVWDGSATISPDGTMIAFWHGFDTPTHGIAVIRADGAGPIVETGPALSNQADYYWSPDSSKILMYPNDGTSLNAYVLDPKGGPWTTLPWASTAELDWQRLAR